MLKNKLSRSPKLAYKLFYKGLRLGHNYKIAIMQ